MSDYLRDVIPTREQLLKAAQHHVLRNPDDKPRCDDCPFGAPDINCINRIMMGIIEILKPRKCETKPCSSMYEYGAFRENGEWMQRRCSVCRTVLGEDSDYCPHCGSHMEG